MHAPAPAPAVKPDTPGAEWTFASDRARGAPLHEERGQIGAIPVRYVVGEFWTAAQRQASSIHEVSYRACFKPQLPAYFIRRFSAPGDAVYDPFSGRGTTAIEAALHGRVPVANDANPLSEMLARPRLDCPDISEVAARLAAIPAQADVDAGPDLSMFYEARTLAQILSLRQYLRERRDAGQEDPLDRWIRMVATNRLTGHSPGFFSVYSLPPNQAVSAQSQQRINQRRAQAPGYRDTHALILRKSRQLQKDLSDADRQNLHAAASVARFHTGPAGCTDAIPDASIQLTVTSPPFLDVVQYADDNWLRCWFNHLPAERIAASISMARTVEAWSAVMADVFRQLHRITRSGGVVAFEVGEVRKGTIRLEEHVVPLGVAAGLRCKAILLNTQAFTKTANIWGVSNNAAGTNSNRIVVFSKA
ncbi:MAG TPA: DNA methyltransferase [Candidatus Binatia bacterium]|nr:DNA methyltransferase [Candidatus Binatia bacterium]